MLFHGRLPWLRSPLTLRHPVRCRHSYSAVPDTSLRRSFSFAFPPQNPQIHTVIIQLFLVPVATTKCKRRAGGRPHTAGSSAIKKRLLTSLFRIHGSLLRY